MSKNSPARKSFVRVDFLPAVRPSEFLPARATDEIDAEIDAAARARARAAGRRAPEPIAAIRARLSALETQIARVIAAIVDPPANTDPREIEREAGILRDGAEGIARVAEDLAFVGEGLRA